MIMGCKRFCYVTVMAALACSIFIFAKPKDKENNSDVKFTARTQLVLIPTLVTDKSGNHITGLKKEDFTVLENGAEQKIFTVEEVTTDTKRLSRPMKTNEFSNSLAGQASTAALRSWCSTWSTPGSQIRHMRGKTFSSI